MLAATAVSVGWLAVTAAGFRSGGELEAGYAVRNYAVVMAILLLLYFRLTGRGIRGEEALQPPG